MGGNIFKKISSSANNIFKKAEHGATSLFKKTADTVHSVSGSVQNIAKKVGNGLEKASGIVGTISKYATPALQGIAVGLGQPELVQPIGQLGGKIKKGLKDASNVANQVSTISGKINNFTGASVNRNVKNGLADIHASLTAQ